MKKLILLCLLLASVKAPALTIGQKVKAVRDTPLMAGATVLIAIPKGSELDTEMIDGKSRAWFQTTFGAAGKPLRGWVRIRDVAAIPNACSSGFEYKCWYIETEQCSLTCPDKVCTNESLYECNYTYDYNPDTGQWEWFNKCGYVTKEICSMPPCDKQCWLEEEKVCGCKKP